MTEIFNVQNIPENYFSQAVLHMFLPMLIFVAIALIFMIKPLKNKISFKNNKKAYIVPIIIFIFLALWSMLAGADLGCEYMIYRNCVKAVATDTYKEEIGKPEKLNFYENESDETKKGVQFTVNGKSFDSKCSTGGKNLSNEDVEKIKNADEIAVTYVNDSGTDIIISISVNE